MPDALLPVGVLGAPLMPELHLELELLQLELELLELDLPPPPPLLGAARRLSSSTSLAWQRGDRPAAMLPQENRKKLPLRPGSLAHHVCGS
eukprot:COSAG06_NODE_1425_length_9497_cov_8.974463_4_plen_91_part_00